MSLRISEIWWMHQKRLTVAQSFPFILFCFLLVSNISTFFVIFIISLSTWFPPSRFWKMAPGSSQHKKYCEQIKKQKTKSLSKENWKKIEMLVGTHTLGMLFLYSSSSFFFEKWSHGLSIIIRKHLWQKCRTRMVNEVFCYWRFNAMGVSRTYIAILIITPKRLQSIRQTDALL